MKIHKSRRVIAGMAAVAAAAMLLTVVTGAGVAGSKDDEKGYIGVYMQDLDGDLREGLDLEVNTGVLINGVEKGSPADEAGMEDGDVVIEFNGTEITSTDELRELVADTEAGQKVKIKIIRDGKEKTLTLVVGEWPDDLTWHSFGDVRFDDNNWHDFGHSVRAFMFRPQLGVQVTELNEGLAPYFKTKSGEGVLVLDVNDESVAEAAGILAGDVIQTVVLALGGVVCLVVIVNQLPGGLGQIIEVASAAGKFSFAEFREGVMQPVRWDLTLQSKTAGMMLLIGLTIWLREYSCMQATTQASTSFLN